MTVLGHSGQVGEHTDPHTSARWPQLRGHRVTRLVSVGRLGGARSPKRAGRCAGLPRERCSRRDRDEIKLLSQQLMGR